MKLRVDLSDFAQIDINLQTDYYADQGGDRLAQRFLSAVDAALDTVAMQPFVGSRFAHRTPRLSGLRKWHVENPFHRHQIFYFVETDAVFVFRIIHSARDLPRRLLRPPESE